MRTSTIPFLLLTLTLTPLGCDDPESPEGAAEKLADADHDAAKGPVFGPHVDGEARPDLLLATVKPDADTTLYFTRGEPDAEGRFAVDVTIHGRDGGFDWGGLLHAEQATPLELFLAVAEADAPVPEAMRRAHDWQARSRPGVDGPRTLAIPERDDATPVVLPTYPSTFSCLSWANFQANMATRFAGSPGRMQYVGSAVEIEEMHTGWFDTSQTDMVVCNYKSSNDPDYDDIINAGLCREWGLGGALTWDCDYGSLHDGYYVRKVYGPVTTWRRYYTSVNPLGDDPLQSFFGIVRREA